MSDTITKPTITSTERVYSAVQELRAAEQIATRETVAELTGLKLTIVDDRLSTLVDEGRLKRLLRGIYELVEVYPASRAISKTVRTDGYIILEIGDEILTLTPREDRTLALVQAGAAGEVAMIETGRQHLFLATELAAQVKKLAREVKELKAWQGTGQSVLL